MPWFTPPGEANLLAGMGVGQYRDMELGQKFLRQPGIASAYRLELNPAQSVNAYGFGGGVGEVDDAVLRHRPSVVHADEDGLVISEVGDSDPASQRKAAVGAGQRVHVEGFAGGGLVSLKVDAVPGGLADLVPVVRLCFLS